jgi:hypothetical protein
VRIALASLICCIGCRSTAPSAPLAHHADLTAPPAIEPVIETPAGSDDCPLRWDELAAAAPPTIELTPITSSDPRMAIDVNDDCPGFDPASTRCAGGVDCNEARMRGGRRAVLTMVGPGGSGRFFSMGLAIDGKAFACMTASTVGWRNLYPVGGMLLPLPWLADVDGDREAELVMWTRLPWGDAEVTNALMPVVYVLDGDRLVRRDDRSHALRTRVSSAYRALAAKTAKDDEQRACYASVAHALGA